MENNKMEQPNSIKSDAKRAKVGIIFFFKTLSLTYFGVIPSYPGYILCLLICFITFLEHVPFLCLNKMSLYTLSVIYSFSPIWVLFSDPCAMVYAQFLSTVNMVITAVEYHTKRARLVCIGTTMLSWCVILISKEFLLSECTESYSTYLKRDVILILIEFPILAAICAGQIDIHLKETKDALTKVRELNSKFEEVNTELKKLLTEKDDFILLFSHETRNPLNILMGNLTLLLDEVDAPQVKSKLIRCKFCADLLLQHLNNILDTGKLTNKGTLEVTPTSNKTYEYIQSISNFMEMLIKKKSSLSPELIIPQRLPFNLKFDMQRVTQVILNLLTNAVKFTSSGPITLVVRFLRKEHIEESDYFPRTAFGYQLLNKNRDRPNIDTVSEFVENPLGSDINSNEQFRREILSLEEKKKLLSIDNDSNEKGYLKIEVQDTGCGLKEEELRKLFQKFSQTHSEGAQRQIGSGLGLWITKSLCELMSGGIRAYSKPGIGTCFSAIIQADSLPMPERGPLKTQPLSSSSDTKSKRRMLIADDDPYNLDVHIHILRELGYDVIETAIDGQDLVDKFKSKPEGYFETVITDVSMPRMDGIRAAHSIREFESSLKRVHKVKIGFITGHSNQNDKDRCVQEPISALFYLPKPIKTSMLESFLSTHNSKSYSSYPLQSLQRNHLNPSTHCISFQKQAPLVLCVDDDVFNLDCLSQMLHNLGAQSIRATSGEEGLSLFKRVVVEEQRRLSLVLMDCRMSGMDGWTACSQMKELLKAQNMQSIPIIGVTGESKERNMQKMKQCGMEDMIQKPVTREELQKLLYN